MRDTNGEQTAGTARGAWRPSLPAFEDCYSTIPGTIAQVSEDRGYDTRAAYEAVLVCGAAANHRAEAERENE